MRVDILYFDAASGHRTSAMALQYALLQQNPDWSVRTVNLADVYDKQPWLVGWFFRVGVAGFNVCMRRERYFFLSALVKLAIGWARYLTYFSLNRWLVLPPISRFWKDSHPDMLVSVTPLMHTIAYEAARLECPDVQCITIPVDHEEMCSGYWFHPRIKQRYLLGTERLREQALEEGVSEDDIEMLEGMLIDPRFYSSSPVNHVAELSQLGLNPELKTVLVSFGGQGTVNVKCVARGIAERKLPVNLICLCGGNQQLLSDMQQMETPFPLFAMGFHQDPPVLYHHLADVAVGKPGTMTLNESLITNTPFVFVKSTGMSPIQSGNETWMIERGVGVMAQTVEVVPRIVEDVLSSSEYVSNARAHHHRGIFDVVAILKSLASSMDTSHRSRLAG